MTRPGRAEVVSTLVVVLLAALGVYALWPRDATPAAAAPPGTAAGPTAGPSAVVRSDADLAPLRAAAALPQCPAPTGAAPAGPLAGVVVPCLGSPGAVDLGAALAGRPVLLNVWASWCGPCREELPALAAYAARPGAVPVLGVDVQDDPGAALALLRDLGTALPSVSDPDGALLRALDVPPVRPVSYLVRPDGSVAPVDPPVPFATADDVAAAVDRLR